MLPQTARLNQSIDFRRVTSAGVRSGRPTLVVHVAKGNGTQSRAGFVVSKAVGGAVVRNRVRRQLRHLVAQQLAASSVVRDVVVRALPAAATAPARVGTDLSSAWDQAMHRLSPGRSRVSP